MGFVKGGDRLREGPGPPQRPANGAISARSTQAAIWKRRATQPIAPLAIAFQTDCPAQGLESPLLSAADLAIELRAKVGDGVKG